MKKIKIIALGLMVGLLGFALLGCGNSSNKISVSTAKKSSDSVAESFIVALACQEYETAVMLTEAYSDEYCFVFAEDIEWGLPRSSFAAITELGFEDFNTKIEGEETETQAEYVVTLYDASVETGTPAEKSFKVKTVLNSDGDWVVSAPDFYYANFNFRTAGGNTLIYIDGQHVSDDLCSDDEAGPTELCRDYIIPYIGKNDIEVRVKCDNYDYTQKVTPNTNNVISSSVSVFKPIDEPEKCFSFVKDTWNAMCARYLAGETASCVQSYIARNSSYDLCNTVWDGFEELHDNDSSDGGYNNKNYNLASCKESSKGGVYWISDTQVLCYFDYELTWLYTVSNTNQSTRQNSSVLLSVENGVYKFFEFLDTGLFFEANNFSNEW